MQKKKAISLQLVPLDKLVHWDRNPKDHDIPMLIRSLKLYGYVRPIMVNENIGKMLFGHGLHEALTTMRDAGEEPPHRVEVDKNGAWSVRVLFCDLEQPLHEPYVILDNRATEAGGWRENVLIDALTSAANADLLADTGFDTADLDRMIANQDPPETTDPPSPVDEAEVFRKKWKVKKGQLWSVPSKTVEGKAHRLLCGSTMEPVDVAKARGDLAPVLMVTDPPYGVSFGTKNYTPSARAYKPIENDHLEGDNLSAFIHQALEHWVAPGMAVYCWSASMAEGYWMLLGMKAAGIHVQSQIVWVKPSLSLGQADYQWRHENCWYGYVKGDKKRRWWGGRTQTTVWEVSRENTVPHPTQKPIDLMTKSIVNSSSQGEVVVDPFLGSGTTALAAEQMGRICVGLEIEPMFLALALERFKLAGLEPELIDG